ncbi:hypothetical protein [Mycobacteroides chelonae]|uniref:hypothetical protein n=1 Tax=Mycobacteroides chelonae TaxID=1774 RepID=UPI001041FED4|nr:hypothetical protein [Mycobacteroides chelonae]
MSATVAPQPTGATLRWYERSVERRFDDFATDWVPDPDDINGLGLWIGVDSKVSNDDSSIAQITIRAEVTLNQPEVSVYLACGVRFNFAGAGEKLPHEEAAAFCKGSGIDYVLGYLRGALTDATRSVGLPGAIMPGHVPEELLKQIETELQEDASEG